MCSGFIDLPFKEGDIFIMVEVTQTKEWQQSRLNGFGGGAEPVEMSKTGADLYIEKYLPDDILLAQERLQAHAEDSEVAKGTLVAEATLVQIMTEFFEDGEDFHVHSDEELRKFVVDCMQREAMAAMDPWASDSIDQMVTETQINALLSNVRGFPPHRYEDDI